MYRAFNLVNCFWNEYTRQKVDVAGVTDKIIVQNRLRSFITNGKIDGIRMRDHWFPGVHANVFISHSHSDNEDALKLADWLLTHCGLTSFIDSCVWGFADDLLKQLDGQYCQNADGSYRYEDRNGSTSHVHMMLSTALSMMIDATECIIFMNTPNSITSSEAVEKTKSPWLFYELAMLEWIKRRSRREHRGDALLENFSGTIKLAAKQIPIEYPVKLGELTRLDAAVLKNWRAALREDVFPLDTLYAIAPE